MSGKPRPRPDRTRDDQGRPADFARPSDSIFSDGKIIGGVSDDDEAPVTGKSVPVIKEPGTAVFAGRINANGALRSLQRSRRYEHGGRQHNLPASLVFRHKSIRDVSGLVRCGFNHLVEIPFCLHQPFPLLGRNRCDRHSDLVRNITIECKQRLDRRRVRRREQKIDKRSKLFEKRLCRGRFDSLAICRLVRSKAGAG
ncbi:hypothetical protein PQR16_29455 [Caballeronia glebae]